MARHRPDDIKMAFLQTGSPQGKIVLKAESNNTGKEREMHLNAMVMNSNRYLTVIQKP